MVHNAHKLKNFKVLRFKNNLKKVMNLWHLIQIWRELFTLWNVPNSVLVNVKYSLYLQLIWCYQRARFALGQLLQNNFWSFYSLKE